MVGNGGTGTVGMLGNASTGTVGAAGNGGTGTVGLVVMVVEELRVCLAMLVQGPWV